MLCPPKRVVYHPCKVCLSFSVFLNFTCSCIKDTYDHQVVYERINQQQIKTCKYSVFFILKQSKILFSAHTRITPLSNFPLFIP